MDTAANEAGVAVENNALVKFGDIQNFRLHYNRFCSPGPSAACDSIIHQWKYISYDHAGMTSQEIAEWEKGVTQIIEHYNRQCKNDVCRKHLRAQKYRYMIEYAGIPQYLYQLESSLITYIHGPRAAIATAGHQIAGSVVEAYNMVSGRSVRGVNRKQVNNSEKSQKPLDGATRTSIRRFELTGQKPNAVLYRQDNDGTITSYAVYDSKVMILKRVDMKGKAHGGVPTPHVIEYGRNYLPNGEIKVHRPRGNPRPARPDEIQYIKED
ncbi:polymorphic toxin type 24 domain-containing protein [Moraxella bovoculi]|uniref:polymorphic toxin type 24 domain-containing protein n=1 Tax=Moraxella bovoculi TaxID=386891 RepID=UPI003F5003FD